MRWKGKFASLHSAAGVAAEAADKASTAALLVPGPTKAKKVRFANQVIERMQQLAPQHPVVQELFCESAKEAGWSKATAFKACPSLTWHLWKRQSKVHVCKKRGRKSGFRMLPDSMLLDALRPHVWEGGWCLHSDAPRKHLLGSGRAIAELVGVSRPFVVFD